MNKDFAKRNIDMPKIVIFKDWESLKRKYKTLDVEIWNSLDAMKKLALLKSVQIEIFINPIFGINFTLNYPEDIYLYDITDKFYLDINTLNKIRKLVYQEKEIGGTIEYYTQPNSDIQINFFTRFGDINRINLDLGSDTHSLFHTHPSDEREFNPPSILDIVSYLAVIIKYIADIIIDLSHKIEHSVDDPLIIQNSIVVSNEAVYVYYISYPLVVSIIKYLMTLYVKDEENFVYEVEKLLEEMELSYASYLFSFNRDLNISDLNEYLNTLSSLGILINRFPYSQFPNVPEVYITL